MSQDNDSPFRRYLRERGGAPSLAEAAIALELPAFPCDADKRPMTQHGFKDASADPATIRNILADLEAGDAGERPPTSTNVVSDAPRSSRFSSWSFPRLRSHPIHRCWPSFQTR